MLLSIRPALPKSKLFDGLNRLLREVMLSALEGRSVDQTVLPDYLYAAVENNLATWGAITNLRATLIALDSKEKPALHADLLLNKDPCDFLTNRMLPLPNIPGTIVPHLKILSVHLFERTGKLVAVEAACGECIDAHFSRFRAKEKPGNGNVCCVCGTEALAQVQAGVDDDEQWRGPYDHLLSKDAYPLFAVHPNNLLPICTSCNSKAKLAQDLLHKDGNRRLSFSPWTEHVFLREIKVTIDLSGLFPRVVVCLHSDIADRLEKLNTWNEVYKIKGRVEGEFLALREKVAEDVMADSDAAFVESLRQRALAKGRACRLSGFNFWRARVYYAVKSMDYASRDAFHRAVQQSSPIDQIMEDVFFN